MTAAPTRAPARPPRAAVLGGVRLWLLWATTRAVAVALLVLVDPWVGDDLDYYARGLQQVADTGAAGALVEYPAHALLVMGVPWLVTGGLGSPAAFPAAMVVALLALDAVFTWALGRHARGGDTVSVGVLTWLLGVPLLGATAFSRFDLVPGVLAGGAVLVIATRERAAAVLLALAAAVKLWPAALVVPLLAASRRLQGTVTTFAVAGLALVGSSVATVGLARTLSPLTWQSDRGLQVESVAATPAVLAWSLGADGMSVAKSPYNAYEVVGPFTGLLASLSTLATVAAVVALVWLGPRVWRRDQAVRMAALPWLSVACVLLVVVPSEVLSPQYLLWLLPVAAAAWARTPRDQVRPVAVWAGLLLLATALTQVVFPLAYGPLVYGGPGAPAVAAALAGRNLLLVVLLVLAVRQVVLRTAPPPGVPARA